MGILPFDEQRPHHKKKNIRPERQLEILHNAHWGTLATTQADGEPYAVPIGFAYDEESGELIFHTAHRGLKIENIARDNRVCFSIVGSAELVTEKFTASFESLVIFGRLERIKDEGQAYQAAQVFCRKFAPLATARLLAADNEEGTDFALMMQKAADFMAMYRLIPSHISSKQRPKPQKA